MDDWDTDDYIESLEQRWRHIDVDAGGTISQAELRSAVWHAESDYIGEPVPADGQVCVLIEFRAIPMYSSGNELPLVSVEIRPLLLKRTPPSPCRSHCKTSLMRSIKARATSPRFASGTLCTTCSSLSGQCPACECRGHPRR